MNTRQTLSSLSPAKEAPSQYRIFTLFQLKKSVLINQIGLRSKSCIIQTVRNEQKTILVFEPGFSSALLLSIPVNGISFSK